MPKKVKKSKEETDPNKPLVCMWLQIIQFSILAQKISLFLTAIIVVYIKLPCTKYTRNKSPNKRS